MLLLCFLFYLWKLTAVGGIPPLVQPLETGSVKAKEATAFILRNLYCHSEDIRACVQSTEAVPFAYNRDSSSFRFLGKFMFLVV
jgi:hypothetical protein